jgi:hypothetical protein
MTPNPLDPGPSGPPRDPIQPGGGAAPSPAPRRSVPLRGWLVAVVLGLSAVLGLVWWTRATPSRHGRLASLSATIAGALGAWHAGGERRGKPNRLAGEKSPYLLQHAYNPVDWYPWGEEAFAKARAENKPIFLSIGYSTCHWCHVMERESFENDSVAALLNRDFVSIKVDREERPDVDRIYMTAMQAMGLGGGWPLNVFLTPDLAPFFGGTYFPPHGVPGRPGMVELLPRVAEAWAERRVDLASTGAQVLEALGTLSAPDTVAADRERLFEAAYRALEHSADSTAGGFGSAPKFPSTVNLNFLLRVWARDPARHEAARAMVVGQLDAMRAGGIQDHLGGGFHRYSTDRVWRVPHFEKMLYDQAQLAWAYLEGYQVTGDPRYAAAARGIFDYVTRDLTSPEGGFDSAEDADSEGEEGKFYVWRPEELERALGNDAPLFAAAYGVTAEGNFEHGASILSEQADADELGRRFHLEADEVEKKLAAARVSLLEVRGRRPRPHRDDKVLTAWNGLMISAFARGARVLDDPKLAGRAERAAEFVWRTLRDPKTGALARRWRDGESAGQGQLDDYAYYALGLLDLYGATLDPQWLERAAAVTEAQVARFWDEDQGGFFESPQGDPSIRVRMKDGFDGAEMAGNSIATLVLVRIGRVLERREWLDKAERAFDYYGRRLGSHPAAMPQLLVAMELAAAPPRHVVIAGRPKADDTQTMLRAFNRRFRPHDELLFVDGGARAKRLAALAPFTAALAARDGRATAFVCVDYACQLPTTDPAAFAAQLEEGSAQGRAGRVP